MFVCVCVVGGGGCGGWWMGCWEMRIYQLARKEVTISHKRINPFIPCELFYLKSLNVHFQKTGCLVSYYYSYHVLLKFLYLMQKV